LIGRSTCPSFSRVVVVCWSNSLSAFGGPLLFAGRTAYSPSVGRSAGLHDCSCYTPARSLYRSRQQPDGCAPRGRTSCDGRSALPQHVPCFGGVFQVCRDEFPTRPNGPRAGQARPRGAQPSGCWRERCYLDEAQPKSAGASYAVTFPLAASNSARRRASSSAESLAGLE